METKTKEYKTTKHSCQATIDLNGNVCSHCGGPLTPIETVDNSGDPTYWSGCESCEIFNYGVKKIIFDIATLLVTERNFVCYSHMDSPYDRDENYKKYWLQSQIGGATSIVQDVLRFNKQLTENQ